MFKYGVIISGGRGMRMDPITSYVPKACVRIGHQELIKYSIDLFHKSGVKYIYATYNHLAKILFEKMKSSVSGFINTLDSDNAYFLSHSFVQSLDEPILVIPCDLIMDIDLKKVHTDYYALGEPAIMIVPTSPAKPIDGDCIISENNIVKELSRKIQSNVYASGLQVINVAKVLRNIDYPGNNFYDIWNELMKVNQLYVSNVVAENWQTFDRFQDVVDYNKAYDSAEN